MYQLVMTLITIGLFAAFLIAGASYVDPQRIVNVDQAEGLLADRNRIELALRAYRVANGVPVPEADWEEALEGYLTEPLEPLPAGYAWLLQEGPEGGRACVMTDAGVTVPPAAASVSCVLTGIAACLAPSSVGLIGEPGWTGCEGMLIVDDPLLRSAGAAAAGGDGSFELTGPDAETYTFTDSARNVFTGQATDLSNLFALTGFDGDIGYWSTSNVTVMTGMARSASQFNAPIGGWDTSNVSGMDRAFEAATSFDQDLSGWCVPLISAEPADFDTGASAWALSRPVWGTCPSETAPVTISLGPAGLPDGERDAPYVGFDFKTVLTVSGADPADLTFSGTGVPAGLTLNADGTLTGTPTESGGINFTVVASHPGGASDGRTYSVIINDPDPLIVEP
jgi:hypothetical protein